TSACPRKRSRTSKRITGAHGAMVDRRRSEFRSSAAAREHRRGGVEPREARDQWELRSSAAARKHRRGGVGPREARDQWELRSSAAARERQRAGVAPREAKKRFGQHFLEPAWVEKLLRTMAPAGDDIFLEIGPGRGALTRPLAARAARVVAFEIDRDLAAALRETAPANLTIVEGDFLDVQADVIRHE